MVDYKYYDNYDYPDVKIAAKYCEGKLLDLNDNVLDVIEDDSTFTICINSRQLTNSYIYKLKGEKIIFKKGTNLFAEISNRSDTSQWIHTKSIRAPHWGSDILLMPFKLDGDLKIRMTVDKTSELCPCAIKIGSEKLDSVNQAYTYISAAVETHRKSHTGNVFEKVYYFENGTYMELSTMRDRYDSELRTLMIDKKSFQIEDKAVFLHVLSTDKQLKKLNSEELLRDVSIDISFLTGKFKESGIKEPEKSASQVVFNAYINNCIIIHHHK